jgi:SAM-dependent methyltransferase
MINLFRKPVKQKPVLVNKGFCYCCGKDTVFYSDNEWLRDYYKCTNCLSIPRERAIMYCLEKFFPDWMKANIFESSPSIRGGYFRLKENPNYVASYFFENESPGKYINGFVNQNLEKLTYKAETFDIVITQDVFEHLFNPGDAFREIKRILKPGGVHIFTTPLINKIRSTEIWAVQDKDGWRFLKEPDFHENPVSKNGSPVTMHWGYDISRYIFDSCGMYTEMVYIDNIELGIRAEFIDVLISRKY